MSRAIALSLAPPDPLGIQWASAHSQGRTYLAWVGPDGSRGIQITHEYLGITRYRRVFSAPRALCWAPIRQSWAAVEDAA